MRFLESIKQHSMWMNGFYSHPIYLVLGFVYSFKMLYGLLRLTIS